MADKLYLGRESENQEPFCLDPSLLTTHGLILGMTGSGKTGLAIAILEELVKAGVPIIAIDPKGDLPNLALLFPELLASDFAKWTDPADAQRPGQSLDQYSAAKAQGWKNGIAKWGLNALDTARLKNKLDLRIFTPGSTVGRAINLLGSFSPPTNIAQSEARVELASSIISGLLSLIDKDVDPLRDPRHVLLVSILNYAWDKEAALSLEDLITHIVDPPFPKVGVFPVDRFLSPDDRMKLALALNNLVASPGFTAWKQGETLDLAELTSAKDGRTPVNIFYLAHLEEKQRQFFVGRLMSQIVSWTRSLAGSSSLRTLVYFDEVAGYLPPYPANPPSKAPILTLLKQSRAAGVGLCLATQNPVDLDYKAISNIGTLMIGRLQTQQDQNRVREGLTYALEGLSTSQLDAEFSKLSTRTFLVRTPASSRLISLQTRHVLSYLRGPITLGELKNLPNEIATVSPPDANPQSSQNKVDPNQVGRVTPPPIPKGFSQSFIDPRYTFGTRHGGFFSPYKEQSLSGGKVIFRPALRATLRLSFSDSKEDFLLSKLYHYIAFPLENVSDVAKLFKEVALETEYLLTLPPDEGLFSDLPDAFDQTEELASARSSLCDYLYHSVTATRFINKQVKLYSKSEETEADFLARCQQQSEDMLDEEVVKYQEKIRSQIDRVEQQMRSAKDKVERLALTATSQKVEGLWKAGEMLMGLFSGRKRSVSSVLSKSRQAMEAHTRSSQAESDLARLEEELLKLQDKMQADTAKLEEEFKRKAAAIEPATIRLARKDIEIDTFEILWVPVSSRI